MINPRIRFKTVGNISPPLHFAARRNVQWRDAAAHTMYHNPAADEEHRQRADNRYAFINQGAMINNPLPNACISRWIFPPANTPGHQS